MAQSATYALLLLIRMWWAARRWLPHVWQLRWRFDRVTALGLGRFGGIVGLAGLAGMLVGQFDNLLVGTLVGVATLGFYYRAYRIAQWPSLLVTSVAFRAAFYTYARLQDDPVRLQRPVTMTLWMVTTLAMPLVLAEALEGVLADRALADGLREKGLRRAAQFTWEKAAQATLGVYQRVAQRA